jgi:hypothetical protein
MFAFDSLAYTRHLEGQGVDRKQAEAHAEAVQKFVIAEVATRTDLQAVKDELKTAMENVTLRLTVRLGAMLAAAAGAVIAALRFL